MKNKMIAKIFAGVMAASLMMFAAGCAKQTESTVAGESTIVESVEESTEASEETEAEASEETEAEVAEETEAAEDGEAEVISLAGVYAREITEEIDGAEVTAEESYEFNEDGTGAFTAQDTVEITWDAEKIYVGENAYEYTVDGDVLKVTADDVVVEYTKKN